MFDEESLLNAIDNAEAAAFGSEDDGDLAAERARAIDYYLGRNVEPAPAGTSQVIDRTVFETIQWVLPSLCRIFAHGDDVVEVLPVGPQDEAQAQQESDYLNYVVTQRNHWFETCLAWFQDALLTKNAYCLAYSERTLSVETERYQDQSAEAVALLSEGEGVEITGFSEKIDEGGLPLFDVTLRRTRPEKRICLRVLPPERCKVAHTTPDHTLEECDYFEYWEWKTLSSLRAEGFDVPDDIESDETVEGEEEAARDEFADVELDEESEPALRRVKARTVWIRHDADGDGIAELQRVLRVGRRILYREETQRIHVAAVVPFINTHRHPGLSLADLVIDLQRIKTALLRQGINNLFQTNQPRTAISSKVNLDDMLVSRPGGIVRVEGSPGQEIFPLSVPFVFPQTIEGLEYIDQVRENRTGVNRQFAGIESDALEKTATEVAQLSSMGAQRVEQIARILAAGVKDLCSIVHELILEGGHERETVKLRGQWVEVDPSTWRTKREMRIVVGYGAGNKDTLLARLGMIHQAQMETIQAGLRIANEANVYETLVEMTKAADFTAPQRFWTDPRHLPPPQPPPNPIIVGAHVETAKIQSQERIESAKIAQDAQESAAKNALDRYRADLTAQLQLALEQMKAGQAVNLEQFRSELKSRPIAEKTMQEIAEEALASPLTDAVQQLEGHLASLADITRTLHAPREVLRDGSGRIRGVRIGGVEREVKRDGRGRVTGIE